jgi:hypothetical protein
MELRFPATTPRVSRSRALFPDQVVLIAGEQFEDGLRRIVVGIDASDESVDLLAKALREIDGRDGMVRWITDMLADQGGGAEVKA